MALPPALVQRFLIHLEALFEEVSAVQHGLTQPASLDASSAERLRVLSHQLAGVAEGYGFPVVGARAQQVEVAIAAADPALAAHVRGLADALADATRGGAEVHLHHD